MEGGVKAFKVDQRVAADDVERQDSGWPVQVHGYSLGGGGGGAGGGCGCAVVADGITAFVAVESPGMVVLSELAVVAFPADAAVANGDEDPPLALHLPVRAAAQTVAAQHLRPALEPVWVLGVGLLLLQEPHRLAVVQQLQLPVQRVCVQEQPAAI